MNQLISHDLDALRELADTADADAVWPTASWDRLRSSGVLAWSVPAEFGGQGLPAADLLAGYEQLGGACLTTAFILSQREAAVRRVVDQGSPEMQQRLLPDLAAGRTFASVGLSQLTTSRQHQVPALLAQPVGSSAYQLDGVIPWVTGAAHADWLVVGATLPDARQILLVLPTKTPGVSVDPPMNLSALAGSLTTEVRCHNVIVSSDWLVAGPAEKVMAGGRGGVGGVETSCLALGLAGAALDRLAVEAVARPEFQGVVERFSEERRSARGEMFRLAAGSPSPDEMMALRVRATTMALRTSQACLAVSKGVGFVRPHPAQRWARQALFFLVWSCPRPAVEGVLAHLIA